MIFYSKVLALLRGAAVLASLGFTAAAEADPTNAVAKTDAALLVYAEHPIKVEDLKRRYGKAVYQAAPTIWVVEKPLSINDRYDFFSYEVNDRGELHQMTGFIVSSCNQVISRYFDILLPIQMAKQGTPPLPALVSAPKITIEVPVEPGNAFPKLGGQSIALQYIKDSPTPCTLMHTFSRKSA